MTRPSLPDLTGCRIGAIAVAAGAIGVSSGAAHASVVTTYVGGGQPDIFYPTTGGVDEFSFSNSTQINGITSGLITTSGGGSPPSAVKLGAGQTVGPATNTPNSSSASLGTSKYGPYYIGLSVANPGNPSLTNYGYAEISEPGCDPASLIGYAFETSPGTPIVTAPINEVPEPGTLALLATGALGVLAIRRRSGAIARAA